MSSKQPNPFSTSPKKDPEDPSHPLNTSFQDMQIHKDTIEAQLRLLQEKQAEGDEKKEGSFEGNTLLANQSDATLFFSAQTILQESQKKAKAKEAESGSSGERKKQKDSDVSIDEYKPRAVSPTFGRSPNANKERASTENAKHEGSPVQEEIDPALVKGLKTPEAKEDVLSLHMAKEAFPVEGKLDSGEKEAKKRKDSLNAPLPDFQLRTPLHRPKKKKVAKDDFLAMTNPKRMMTEVDKEKKETSPARKSLFYVDRIWNPKPAPKRKRSASAERMQVLRLDTNQEGEDDENDYLDLTQSLLTLQINNNNRMRKEQTKDKQFSTISPLNQKSKTPKPDPQTKSYFVTGSYAPQARYKDWNNRRTSNYAVVSNYMDDQSNLVVEPNKDSEKDDKEEDDNEDMNSSHLSVSLDDQDIDELETIDLSVVSTRLDGFVSAAIRDAEDSRHGSHPSRRRGDEYESLLLGQSIWSTDFPKDSKKSKFIEGIQQQMATTSDMAASKKAPEEPMPRKDSDDFDALQKNIEEVTSNIGGRTADGQEEDSQAELMYVPPQGLIADNMKEGLGEPTLGDRALVDPSLGEPGDQNVSFQQPEVKRSFERPLQTQNFIQQSPYQQNLPGQVAQAEDGKMLYQQISVQNASSMSNHGQQQQEQPGQQHNFDYQHNQNITSGMSVHSGAQVNFPGHHTSSANIGMYEYPDNASSNYTQHPYSVYNQKGIAGQQQPHEQPQPMMNEQHNYNNFGNRAHILINRHINKYMMNPMYKSKGTLATLRNNRYVGIPFRSTGNYHMNDQLQHVSGNIQYPQAYGFNDFQPGAAGGTYYQQKFGEEGQALINQIPDQPQYGAGNTSPIHRVKSQQFHIEKEEEPSAAQKYLESNKPSQNMPQEPNSASIPSEPFPSMRNLGNQFGASYLLTQSPQENHEAKGMGEENHEGVPQEEQAYVSKAEEEYKNTPNPLAAAPFYPKNFNEQKTKNIMAAAGPMFAGAPMRPPPKIIGAPIPIPIMGGRKPNPGQRKDLGLKGPKLGNQAEASNSIFMKDFYREQITDELDKRLKETTQNLESKLIKAAEINNEEDDDDENEEEESNPVEISAFNLSVERSVDRNDSQDINLKNQKPEGPRKTIESEEQAEKKKIQQFEEKIKRKNQKAEIFKKLQDQLKEFKQTTDKQGHNNASSISPKRSQGYFDNQEEKEVIDLKNQGRFTPFRQDVKSFQVYLNKVSNLMKMVNEVDDLTNTAELKNKIAKQKYVIMKIKAERDSQISNLHQLHEKKLGQAQEQEQALQQQLSESQAVVSSLNSNLQQLQEQSEFNERRCYELTQQLEQTRNELMISNNQLQECNSVFNSQLQQANSQVEQLQQNVSYLHGQVQSGQQQLQQLQFENSSLKSQTESMDAERVHLQDQISQLKARRKDPGQDQDEDNHFSVPLEEQLDNANAQIKDLQEYIKKKSVEDAQQSSMRIETLQRNELAHVERYNNLQQQMNEMESEKDQMINSLQEFIKKQMPIGFSPQERPLEETKDDRFNESGINDLRSLHNDSIASIVKGLNTAGECHRCPEKDKRIAQLEGKVRDQEDCIRQLSEAEGSFNQKRSQDGQKQSFGHGSSPNVSGSGQSMGTSGGMKSSNKILLNKLIRQIKVFADNQEEQETSMTVKLHEKLNSFASQQSISIFDEEEMPDPDLVTPTLLHDIITMSIDIMTDVIQEGKMSQFSRQEQAPQVRIVEKVKIIELGFSLAEMKEIQNQARVDRKACHHIIVEIEKLIYEMNSILSTSIQHGDNASVMFNTIQDTYLKLPHRLKPIFDHCKKIESILVKAIKAQDELKSDPQKQSKQAAPSGSEAKSLAQSMIQPQQQQPQQPQQHQQPQQQLPDPKQGPMQSSRPQSASKHQQPQQQQPPQQQPPQSQQQQQQYLQAPLQQQQQSMMPPQQPQQQQLQQQLSSQPMAGIQQADLQQQLLQLGQLQQPMNIQQQQQLLQAQLLLQQQQQQQNQQSQQQMMLPLLLNSALMDPSQSLQLESLQQLSMLNQSVNQQHNNSNSSQQ